MRMKDVGASLQRHWPVALAIFFLIPIVVGIYLWNHNPSRPPARYTTSADLLIPAVDQKTGTQPTGVPPVLFHGQVELALSPQTKAFALSAAHLGPEDTRGVAFNASLNDTATIMSLSVSAPKPEPASTVLDQYVIAYQDGRRQSVLDAAIEQQDIERRVISVLNAKLANIEGQLTAAGVGFPPQVPDGSPVAVPPGTPQDIGLMLYQRNSTLNEIQRRQVDYGLQATTAAVPGDYTTVVQRRNTARISPPPPSPWPTALGIIAVGLLLCAAVPLLMDRLDRSVTDVRGASATLRARVLGSIPPLSRRMRHDYAPRGSPWEIAFRSLAATSISTDSLPKALMITSPVGTVQDTVAANFARGLASLGARVVLIATEPRQRWFLWGDEGDDDEYDELPAEPTNGRGAGAAPEPAEVPPAGDLPETSETPAVGEPETPGNGNGTTTPPGGLPTAAVPEIDLARFPTFQNLLEEAQAGLLPDSVLSRLATVEYDHFYVVPPSEEEDVPLDGLPPLLEALTESGIEVIVLAGPALLEDPNATIMAWSTRNVLWALEIGHVDSKDAQLAADRLEIAGVLPFGVAIVERHVR